MTWFSPLKRADLQSGRLLGFALALLVAVQAPDARLTWMTVHYMDQLRAMTAATSDVVIEDSPLSAYPEIGSLRDLSWLAIQIRVLADQPQQIPNFKRRRDGQRTATSLPDLPGRYVWRP